MVWTQPVVALGFGNRPWSNGTDRRGGGDLSQAGHGPTDFDLEADFALEGSHGCLPRRGGGGLCLGSVVVGVSQRQTRLRRPRMAHRSGPDLQEWYLRTR